MCGGDKPSKEVFMHRAFYQAREMRGLSCICIRRRRQRLSCLSDVDQSKSIPPLTPYFVMRVGRRMPVVPYYRPGDPSMEPAINAAAKDAKAVLLSNHGPVVSGKTLLDAVYAAEELEEAAKLFMCCGARLRVC